MSAWPVIRWTPIFISICLAIVVPAWEMRATAPASDDVFTIESSPSESRAETVDPEDDELKTLADELDESYGSLHRWPQTPARRSLASIENFDKDPTCVASDYPVWRKTHSLHAKLEPLPLTNAHVTKTPLKSYLHDVTPFTELVKSESERRSRVRGPVIDRVRANFQASCGRKFDKFIPELRRQAKAHGVPVETLLSMMTVESVGDCFARTTEGVSDAGETIYSRGLFQIHAHSAHAKACTEREKARIRRTKSFDEAPACLENPKVNLAEAIRVLDEKIQTLTRYSEVMDIDYLSEREKNLGRSCWLTMPIRVGGFEETRLRDRHGHWKADLWRIAVSAYNGGETWVFRAKRNIETFNALNGAHVNPYNWASLKDFYFRRALTREQQLRYFGIQERDRDMDNAILNVIYAENVVPEEKPTRAPASMKATLAELWRRQLRPGHG